MYTFVESLVRNANKRTYLVLVFTLGLFSVQAMSFNYDELSEKSKNLYTAYELAACEDESILWQAFVSSVNYSNSSSSAVMAEVMECQRVSTCDGDAEQWTNGGNLQICGDPGLTDLDIGVQANNRNFVAMNWGGWTIPPGSTITNAYVQFTALSNSVGPASFTIYGEAADNAALFSMADDVVSRTGTASTVAWSPGTWTMGDAGTAQRTPDISAIIQEIVNRPGYAMGNNMVVGISGKGERQAYDFGNNAALAPELCITYDVPDPPTSTCNGCPDLSVVSLDGIPNFPTVDILNLCSAPDTASILIYNGGECLIEDISIQITFDDGLSYGGFVFQDLNSLGTGVVAESDLSDLTAPIFSITEIDSSSTYIVNFAVQADCNVDIESEMDINFDVDVSFTYSDDNGTTPTCTEGITEVGAYNSGIRVPVLNLLTVSPSELNITQSNTQECQRILISQDGIQAFLDGFQFQINGLDESTYMVTRIDVSDVLVPDTDYSYDATSQTLSFFVTSDYFIADTGSNNSDGDELFETNETIFIDVCYQVMGCTDEANFLNYNAFYGCNNQICGDISGKEGAVNFTPDFGATVSAVSSNIQYGGICGDNLIYDITVNSNNTDPQDGLWEDLIFKYKACLLANTSIVGLELNGAAIPAEVWSMEGSTLIIDLTQNTTDFDGAGGIDDIDGDGIFDDLPGGQSVTISTNIEIGCAAEGSECSAISCTLNQFEVNGLRNCGQDFQQFATIGGDGPVNFVYGATSTSWTRDLDWAGSIGVTDDFTTVCDVWLPTTNGYDFSYDFSNVNLSPCAGAGNIELVINVIANGDRITDIRYTDGSATYQGVPVPAGDVTYEYQTTGTAGIDLDTFALEIRIAAGDPLAATNDYAWNLDFRGDCYPDDYTYLSYKIVENCSGCGTTDPCEIVRACDNAQTYIRWRGCGCECNIFGFIDTIQRVNYGYSDKAMTQKLTAEDVPVEDRQRFVPGDTMYYRAGFEILNSEVFYTADFLWDFYVNPREEAGPIMLDVYNSSFGGWFYEDGATGEIVEIGIPDCFFKLSRCHKRLFLGA